MTSDDTSLMQRAQARIAEHGSGTDALKSTLAADNRAQTGNMTSLVIGILIAGLVIMEVFIPTITDAAANVSGTAGDIASLLPLFAALLLLIALASPLMRRT